MNVYIHEANCVAFLAATLGPAGSEPRMTGCPQGESPARNSRLKGAGAATARSRPGSGRFLLAKDADPKFVPDADLHRISSPLSAGFGQSMDESIGSTAPARFESAEYQLVNQPFIYRRVGSDQRPMMFLEGGLIGRGRAARERFWRLRIFRGRFILEIRSDSGTTCRLEKDTHAIWRGRWLIGERMAVELLPISAANQERSQIGLCPRRNRALLPSLFVVSLPRSLSTKVYDVACKALGLSKPTWTSVGEILNIDRFSLYGGPNHDACRKFISESREPHLFREATEFLNSVVEPCGYAYKDVVQPFVVSEWIRDMRMPAIRIKRNIADIAYSMLSADWRYPSRLFPEIKDRTLALVMGLLLAEKALDEIPCKQVQYEDLVEDEGVLHRALCDICGREAVQIVKFIDKHFRERKAQVFARRSSKAYADIVNTVERAKRRLASFRLTQYS